MMTRINSIQAEFPDQLCRDARITFYERIGLPMFISTLVGTAGLILVSWTTLAKVSSLQAATDRQDARINQAYTMIESNHQLLSQTTKALEELRTCNIELAQIVKKHSESVANGGAH